VGVKLAKAKAALLAMQRYSWEQAVTAIAFMEAGDTDTAIQMCYEAVNRQTECGRLANIGYQAGVTDPIAILPVLKMAYEKAGDNRLADAMKKAEKWILHDAPRSPQGIVYHMDNARQLWVDALYMMPPALAACGYLDEAVKQADGYIAALYNRKAKLFHHIWDEGENAWHTEGFWGVGNGWAIAGLARVIDCLPPGAKRDEYIGIVKDVIAAALPLATDGLFHNILDEKDSFVEANFAQMLCYTVARGVAGGWLSQDLLTKAAPIREAIYKCVDDYGFVRPVCGAPHFNSPGIAPEGQAFFILMESAWPL
jgi:rhamnogalacturonyl hydrolase YesR